MSAVYGCPHCGEVFKRAAVLGGHVHAKHPEHHRPLPKRLRLPRPPIGVRREPVRSLKRSSDAWPGRP